MEKLDLQTPDFTTANIARLAELFPHCVTESKRPDGTPRHAIDFDLLSQELSHDLVEGPQERYRLDWPGKREALALANEPIRKTLRPSREESVDFDHTKNLYIEGDNLDALKLLQETYLGTVKMIYIDPPYNTGNDFIYEDDFTAEQEAYQRGAGEKDAEGNRMMDEERWRQNTTSNGRFHSDWLSMIYARLKLARNLLRDDGVIFISIDDGEQSNLKRLCDEIFGEESFVGIFPWRKRTAKSDVPFGVSQDFEWVISYANHQFIGCILGKGRQYYETPDLAGRPWRVHDLTKQTSASERPNSFFTIINPKNGTEYPANSNRTWAITAETFPKYLKDNRIVFPGDYDFLNLTRPGLRYFKADDEAKSGELFGFVPVSTNLPSEVGMSQDGTKSFVEIFDNKLFSFPKPVSLLKYFTQVSTNFEKNPIILDFFSGSATTAHAVMQLNAEDGGTRRHIMVQLPEPCDEKSEAFKAGYATIAEIGKERIRRAGKKILSEWQAKQAKEKPVQGDLLHPPSPISDPPSPPDIGFRVLKVDSSNMADVYYQPDELTQDDLTLHVDNLRRGRSNEDLLFQVLLDWGVDLSLPITRETFIIGKKAKDRGKEYEVFFVDGNAVAACFDMNVSEELVKELAKRTPLRAVFRDAGYASDAAKINIEQIFKALSPHTELRTL